MIPGHLTISFVGLGLKIFWIMVCFSLFENEIKGVAINQINYSEGNDKKDEAQQQSGKFTTEKSDKIITSTQETNQFNNHSVIDNTQNNNIDYKNPVSESSKDNFIQIKGIIFPLCYFLWVLFTIEYFIYSIVAGSAFEFYLGTNKVLGAITFGFYNVLIWFLAALWKIGTIMYAAMLISFIQTVLIVFQFFQKQNKNKDSFFSQIIYYSIGIIISFFAYLVQLLSLNGLLYSICLNTDFFTGIVFGNRLFVENMGSIFIPNVIKNVILCLVTLTSIIICLILANYTKTFACADKKIRVYYLISVALVSFIASQTFISIVAAYVDSAILVFMAGKKYKWEEAKNMRKLGKFMKKTQRQQRELERKLKK